MGQAYGIERADWIAEAASRETDDRIMGALWDYCEECGGDVAEEWENGFNVADIKAALVAKYGADAVGAMAWGAAGTDWFNY